MIFLRLIYNTDFESGFKFSIIIKDKDHVERKLSDWSAWFKLLDKSTHTNTLVH